MSHKAVTCCDATELKKIQKAQKINSLRSVLFLIFLHCFLEVEFDVNLMFNNTYTIVKLFNSLSSINR